MSEDLIDDVFKIAANLREFTRVEVSYEAKNPAKHLNIADKKGAKIFLCLGEDEAKRGEIWYKNLDDASEKRVKIEKLKEEL